MHEQHTTIQLNFIWQIGGVTSTGYGLYSPCLSSRLPWHPYNVMVVRGSEWGGHRGAEEEDVAEDTEERGEWVAVVVRLSVGGK